MAKPLAIITTGMTTGVGLTAPSSCAAIRAGITGFAETQFMDRGGKWILGSQVWLPVPQRGIAKLVAMAVNVIREVLSQVDRRLVERIPLLLCVAESSRVGRFNNLEESLVSRVQKDLGVTFHAESRVIAQGRMSGITAIQVARSAVLDAAFPFCLIVGVDSFLVAPTLVAFEDQHRVLTSKNPNGFIPGEAAAAILVGPVGKETRLKITAIGSGAEPAPIGSGEPLRGDGLAEAFRSVLADAGLGWEQLDYRITDLNGEQYFFREAALALSRRLRPLKPEFDIWHAADCIGEVGAAAAPVALAVAYDAATKHYAPGPGVLCHFSCDGHERAAVVLQAA